MVNIDSRIADVDSRGESNYSQFANGEWRRLSWVPPEEIALNVFVNEQELVTILCTPEQLNFLVIGYLRSEGLITSLDDIAVMRVCLDESLAEIRLTHEIIMPTKQTVTSGCGGGISFETEENLQPLYSSCRVSPTQILSSVKLLQGTAENGGKYSGVRKGMHVSALSDGNNLVVKAEDIGRHNTLDKIWGECMLRQIPTEDLLLLTTGRISSEMLRKAAKMGIPVVVSLNSATNRAIQLGAELGITVVGYAHGSRLSLYCGEDRLLPTGESALLS